MQKTASGRTISRRDACSSPQSSSQSIPISSRQGPVEFSSSAHVPAVDNKEVERGSRPSSPSLEIKSSCESRSNSYYAPRQLIFDDNDTASGGSSSSSDSECTVAGVGGKHRIPYSLIMYARGFL